MANRNTMRAARILCGLLVGLLVGCGSERPTVAEAERAVYEAFFATVAQDRNPVLFLDAATDNAWFEENPFWEGEWGPYLDVLGGLSMDLAEELYRVNSESMPIAKNLRPANAVLMPADYAPPDLTSDDLLCLFAEDRPNIETGSQTDCGFMTYYSVSRVAFSRDQTHALLKILYHCRPLCAHESFVSFKRDGQRWQIIGRHTLWIS